MRRKLVAINMKNYACSSRFIFQTVKINVPYLVMLSMRGKEPPADIVPESSDNPSAPPWPLCAASMSTEFDDDPNNVSTANNLLSNWLTSLTACWLVILPAIGVVVEGDLIVLDEVSPAIARSKRLGKLDVFLLNAWHDIRIDRRTLKY